MGRPSRYSNALGDRICERLIDGESIRAICDDPEMPGLSTVMRWLASDADMYKGFREQYAHARDSQAERYAQEIVTIADTCDVKNPLEVQKARLRIDARKWTAAKLLPKKYGTDRVQHAGDEDAPLAVTINRVNKRKADS